MACHSIDFARPGGSKAMATVVAVLQCKEWGDETRKLRLSFPKGSDQGLSYTGEELQGEILSKISGPRASGDDDGKDMQEWVEIYENERQCFVSLRDDDLCHVNIAPRFGRLVRCNAYLHSDACNTPSSTATCQSTCRSDETQQQKQTPPLAIMGRYFHYDQNGLDFCGKQLVIKERSNELEEDGTGLNIWDGAILLAKYLELHSNVIKGKRVLELGSGPGFVGIAAGFAGASDVVLTDLQYCLPLMEENVQRNMSAAKSSGCEGMDCRVLDWFRPPSHLSQLGFKSDQAPDVVLIADCVWLEELVGPLIQTIQQIMHLSAPAEPNVIISYQRRGKGAHEAFMAGLQGTFDTIEEIGDDAELNKPDVMHIFECANCKK